MSVTTFKHVALLTAHQAACYNGAADQLKANDSSFICYLARMSSDTDLMDSLICS